MATENIYDELQWRGLINDCTDAVELKKRVASGPLTLYAGFDPKRTFATCNLTARVIQFTPAIPRLV